MRIRMKELLLGLSLVLAVACEGDPIVEGGRPLGPADKDKVAAPVVEITDVQPVMYPYPSTEGAVVGFKLSCESGLKDAEVSVSVPDGFAAVLTLSEDKGSGQVAVTMAREMDSASIQVTVIVENAGGRKSASADLRTARLSFQGNKNVSVSAERQELTLGLDANVDFVVEKSPGDPDGVVVEKDGEGVKVVFPENGSLIGRSGAFSVKDVKGILPALEFTYEQACIVGSRLTDSLALVKFFNALDGEHWEKAGVVGKNNEFWNTEHPLEDWYGVETDYTTGRVKGLRVIVRRPFGGTPANPVYEDSWINLPIPDCIGELVELQRLDLSGSHFTGGIPESIGNLKKLKQLVLRDCNLEGEIPQSIGNLSSLNHLDLWGNNLSGNLEDHGMKNIVSNLRKIYLGGHFSGNFPEWLSDMVDGGPLSAPLSGSNLYISGRIPDRFATFSYWSLPHYYVTPDGRTQIDSGSTNLEHFIEEMAYKGYALWVGEQPEGVEYNGDHWVWKPGYGPVLRNLDEWPGYYKVTY